MTCLGFKRAINRPPSASSYGILGRAETVATRRTGNWFLAMFPGRCSAEQ